MRTQFAELKTQYPGQAPSAEPRKAGFDRARLRRLDAFLKICVDDERLAGLNALIVRRGHVAYATSIGCADLNAKVPMRSDTLFRIFSLTKPVVSAAVMALLEEGRLLLGDPVHTYIPEIAEMQVYTVDESDLVPQASEMVVADLMSHTSGLVYGGDLDHPVDRLWNDAALFRRRGTMADVLARLKTLPLKFQPGARFAYGISHDVLGVLLERLENRSLGEILDERVFRPLGMSDTGFSVATRDLDRLAVLYQVAESGALQIADPASAHSRWADPVTFEAGGEGLVSTVPDFYRFASMLLSKGLTPDGRYLSRKSVELMTSNRLSDAQRTDMWMPGYGFGMGVGVLVDPAVNANLGSPGEFTWAGSASTFFWADPKEELVAILFAQLEPSASHTIARSFKALMYQALI